MARSNSSADTGPARWDGPDLILRVQVQPRARRDALLGLHGGALKIALTAPPVDGQANAALCEYLAGVFGVPKRQVTLLRGDTARHKQVRITAPRRLPEALDFPPKPPA